MLTTDEESINSQESKQKNKKYKTALYLNAMNENDKLLNHKIIRNMNKRINFLKNPRYVNQEPTITIREIIEKPATLKVVNHSGSPFRVIPKEVVFTEYLINCVYEIEVTLTNVTDKLRKIRCVPPSIPEFSIQEIKYPLGNSCIAPGMSAKLPVRFFASSLSVFDDAITVITEEDAFQILVKARKEPPKLTLSGVLDCLSCWVGDRVDMVFRVTNKGGDGGFKFFCEKEEDDLKQTGETIKLNNFTIFPVEFYIQKNQTQEIFVNFKPYAEGIIQENVLLACDNMTNATYTLKGQANMVELSVISLDNNPIQFQEKELKTLYFEDAIPKKKYSRQLTIKNLTKVKVKFHWGLYKNSNKDNKLILDENEAHAFSVSPKQGIFDSEAEIIFNIEFFGEEPFLYYEYACLIIDDIPVEAIRNPPESIKALIKEKQDPGYIGSNLARPSITYYEFELVGNVKFCSLDITPPFYVFPEELFIGQTYKKVFIFKNLSDIDVKYSCKLHCLTDENLSYSIENSQGTVLKNSNVDIMITFSSPNVGKNKKWVFLLESDYGNPLSFEVVGNFIGPIVKFNNPRINFGLIKAGCVGEFNLILENLSTIPAPIIMRNTKSTKLNFSVLDPSQTDSQSKTFYDLPVETDQKIFFEPQAFVLAPLQTRQVKVAYKSQEPETVREMIECLVKNGETLAIEAYAEIQMTHISLNRFKMDFECLYAGNTYEIASMHPQQIKLQNLGNIPTKFVWEPINKPNVLISFEPKEGTIPPKTDLPIKVIIKPLLGGKLEEILVCECEGLEYPLGFEINTQIFGLSVLLEQIENEDGTVLTKVVREFQSKKISINEEKNNEKNEKHAKFTEENPTNPSVSMLASRKLSTSRRNTQKKSTFGGTPRRRTTQKLTSTSRRNKGNELSSSLLDDSIEVLVNPKLEKLEFLKCKINQAKQAKFIIKNTSGINTNFKLCAENYEPLFYKQVSPLKSPKKPVVGSKDKSFKSSIRSSIRKTSFKQDMIPDKCPVLLTDKLEKTDNFYSEAGKALNQERKLSKDQKFFLQNNKGIAIVCEPNEGILNAYETVEIVVTVFNDICGMYEDNLVIDIKGLDPIKIPVLINVNGSPIIVTPNQVGVSFKGEYPEVNIGNVLRNQGPVQKKFKISNTGPKNMEIEWKIYELSDKTYENTDFFRLEFGGPIPGTDEISHLNWIPEKPSETHDNQVVIYPPKATIPGRNHETFTVTFTTATPGKYNAIMIAEPRLSQNNSEVANVKESNLQDLVVAVQAFSIQPSLHIDKAIQLDGLVLVNFEKWSFMDSQKETQSVCLVNKFRTNFIFTLEIEGPFKIISTYTNSPLKYELSTNNQTFNLAENTNLELKIAFQAPKAKDPNLWPMTQRMYQYGSLTMHFSNGDSQKFNLRAELLRPILSLNKTGFEGKDDGSVTRDFGVVHIKNFKTVSMYLSNITKVPGKWKLLYVKFPQKNSIGFATKTKLEFENEIKTDDPTVFEFSKTEGVIYGPSIPLNSLPYGKALPSDYTTNENLAKNINPDEILINFRPKKNILYKCKYKIIVEEGNVLEFELKGTGTYEEAYEK